MLNIEKVHELFENYPQSEHHKKYTLSVSLLAKKTSDTRLEFKKLFIKKEKNDEPN